MYQSPLLMPIKVCLGGILVCLGVSVWNLWLRTNIHGILTGLGLPAPAHSTYPEVPWFFVAVVFTVVIASTLFVARYVQLSNKSREDTEI